MNQPEFTHRDVLTRETAHLSADERLAIAACLKLAACYAVDLPPQTPEDTAVEAIALKLFTLNHAPPRWARTLIAKAALEIASVAQGEVMDATDLRRRAEIALLRAA